MQWKTIGMLLGIAALQGCASRQVNCEWHLRRINAPITAPAEAKPVAPSQDTAAPGGPAS